MSLLDRWRRMKLRWKIPLVLLLLAALGLLALLLVLWLGWRSRQDLLLTRFIPQDAAAAVRIPGAPRLLRAWDDSPLRRIAAGERARLEAVLREAGVELPACVGAEFRFDLGRAIPPEAPSFVTPERVLAAVERDVLLCVGTDAGRRWSAFATRLPFTTYAAARVGLWALAPSASTAGVPVHRLEAGGLDVHLTLAGDVLIAGTTAASVAALARAPEAGPGPFAPWLESAEAGTPTYALDLAALRTKDPELLAGLRDFLHAIPVREATWTFDLDACRTLSGRVLIGDDGLSLDGTATVDPGRLPARLAGGWGARPSAWTAAEFLPESTVCVSLGRGDGVGLWETFGSLVRDESRSALHPALGDVAAAAYRDLAAALRTAEERGLNRELAPLLGGEAAWAAFVEEGASPGRGAPGIALVVETGDAVRLLQLLDRWCGELSGEYAVALERVRIGTTEARRLTSEMNRWPELLSPAYAVVRGAVLLSTSFEYLRHAVEQAADAGAREPAWRRNAREVISLRGTGAAVLDFTRAAAGAERTAPGLAELLSDRVDRAALRASLRARVERETGLTGEPLEQRLDEAVARGVEDRKEQIRGGIVDGSGVLRRFVTLSAEWSVEGPSLTYRVVLLTP